MNNISDNITTYTDNKGNPFMLHAYVHQQRIIPYDTFDIGNNEYAITKIFPASGGEIYLNILAIAGPHFLKRYTLPLQEIEKYELQKLQELLDNYEN